MYMYTLDENNTKQIGLTLHMISICFFANHSKIMISHNLIVVKWLEPLMQLFRTLQLPF